MNDNGVTDVVVFYRDEAQRANEKHGLAGCHIP